MLGALLASWHRQHQETLDEDVVAHLADARALGDATEALGEVLETASLERWNDDPARSRDEVLGAFDRLLQQLEES